VTSPPKTLALLIDGDNARLRYTKQIIQFCQSYGTLTKKKAYGDWKKPPLISHGQILIELGVKRVQQNRLANNATDMKLAMDVALMVDKGEANIYFIVSSDEDFSAVCEHIRQKGAKVIGIGSKKITSGKLKAACNTFFYVEDIVKDQSKAPAKSPSTPKPQPKPKVPKTLKLLMQAYQQTPQKNGWVHIAQLRQVLAELDQQFDQRFAGKKMSTWLKAFPDQFEVEGHLVRSR
jgi:uncharacterized LabA/DUF88 family protein